MRDHLSMKFNSIYSNFCGYKQNSPRSPTLLWVQPWPWPLDHGLGTGDGPRVTITSGPRAFNWHPIHREPLVALSRVRKHIIRKWVGFYKTHSSNLWHGPSSISCLVPPFLSWKEHHLQTLHFEDIYKRHRQPHVTHYWPFTNSFNRLS